MFRAKYIIVSLAVILLLGGWVLFGPDPLIPSDFCLTEGVTAWPTHEWLSWLPDSESLLFANHAGKVYLANLQEGAVPKWQATRFQGNSFAYSPVTNLLAVVKPYPTGGIVTRIYDLESGELLASVREFAGGDWSPDGRYIVGDLNTEDGTKVAVFDMMNPEVEPIAVLPAQERGSHYSEGWSSSDEWLTVEIARDTGIKIEVVGWASREVVRLYEFEGCQ